MLKEHFPKELRCQSLHDNVENSEREWLSDSIDGRLINAI
jgi:hypothetical protein